MATVWFASETRDPENQDLVVVTPGGAAAFSLDPEMLTGVGAIFGQNGSTADLSFEPASDAFGNFTVEVAAEDDGGGDNRSEAQNLTIVILPVNDPP